MDNVRHFRRMIRNMRKASELYGRLLGAGFEHRGKRLYRLVPAKAFDETLALLNQLGGHVPGVEQHGGEQMTPSKREGKVKDLALGVDVAAYELAQAELDAARAQRRLDHARSRFTDALEKLKTFAASELPGEESKV